jgi:hypothetical protein
MRKLALISGQREPFTGRELRKYLEEKHGAVYLRQPGTSHISMRLDNGQRVGCPPPSDPVEASLTRAIARAVGMTYPQIRADIGYPIVNKGKPRFKPVEDKPKPVGKPTVRRVLAEVQAALEYIDAETRQGDRDPAILRKAHEALCGARTELTGFRTHMDMIRQLAEDQPEGPGHETGER